MTKRGVDHPVRRTTSAPAHALFRDQGLPFGLLLVGHRSLGFGRVRVSRAERVPVLFRVVDEVAQPYVALTGPDTHLHGDASGPLDPVRGDGIQGTAVRRRCSGAGFSEP